MRTNGYCLVLSYAREGAACRTGLKIRVSAVRFCPWPLVPKQLGGADRPLFSLPCPKCVLHAFGVFGRIGSTLPARQVFDTAVCTETSRTVSSGPTPRSRVPQDPAASRFIAPCAQARVSSVAAGAFLGRVPETSSSARASDDSHERAKRHGDRVRGPPAARFVSEHHSHAPSARRWSV